MLLNIKLAALLFTLCLGFTTGRLDGSQAQQVRVTKVTYQGWPGSLRISNGIVEAVVVPELGRIMSFRFVDEPATDPLFRNPDPKVIENLSSSGAWTNPGGDKIWPSPQSDWVSYIGGVWPPDPAFESSAQIAIPTPDGVRMTTSDSAIFGLCAIRTITMVPGVARLYITQTFVRVSPPEPNSSVTGQKATVDSLIGLWSITEIKGNSVILLPFVRTKVTTDGYVTFDTRACPIEHSTALPIGWSKQNALLVGRRDSVTSTKIGTCTASGWVGAVIDGKTLFSKRLVASRFDALPDGGCNTEIYCNSDPIPFIEIELLGPMQSIAIGRSASDQEVWELKKLAGLSVSDDKFGKVVAHAIRLSNRLQQ